MVRGGKGLVLGLQREKSVGMEKKCFGGTENSQEIPYPAVVMLHRFLNWV